MTSRARSRPAPLVAVVVNVLIVCTLVAGIGASLPLVQAETLHTRLAGLPADAGVVTAVSTYDDEDPDAQDRAISEVLAPVTSVAGGDVVRRLDSGSYDLDGARGAWSFTALSGADDRVDHPSGRAPTGASGAVEVAVPSTSGLAAGDRLGLRDRADGDRVDAVVVGTWQVDPDSERWLGELTRDVLLVSPERFGEVAGAGSSARWRAVPALSALDADQLDELSAAVSIATTSGMGRATEQTSASVRTEPTGLIDALAERARELVVLRALLLVPAALLLLLGAACLFLVAAGLADSRTREQSLLRSRGAGPRQLVVATTLETLLLCGLAVAVAPFLAHVVIRVGDLRPPLSGAAWVAAALAGGVCAVALVVPTVLRALTGDRGEQLSVERQRRRTLTALVATVLLVVVLGGLAVVELRGFGETVRAASVSAGTVDPLLVIAPALLLLAMAVLASLLVLPLLFRAIAGGVGRRGVSLALGSRFAARSAARTVPLTLVVILASGTLSFAAAQRLSSADARDARADFEVGADVRVQPPVDSRRAGVVAEHAALQSIPGVTEVTAVRRDETYVDDLPADALVAPLDAATAPDILGADVAARGRWRELVTRPWRDPDIGVALPEGSKQLTVTVGDDDVRLKRVLLTLADADGDVRIVPGLGDGRSVTVDLGTGLDGKVRLVSMRAGTLDRYGPLADRKGTVPARVTADESVVATSGNWWTSGDIYFVRFGGKPPRPAATPVLLTEDLAAGASLSVGDTAELRVLGVPVRVELVATAPYLQTTGGRGSGVLLDAGTALPALVAGGLTDQPDEWWLTVPDDSQAAVTAAVEEQDRVAETVITRRAVVHRLDDDPSTGGAVLGQLLALTAGGSVAVGALLLLSVVLLRRRERGAQDRTLVTVGAHRRDLLGVLGSEYALTAGAGVVTGIAVGAAVAQVTLVSMVLGPDGQLLVPAPQLHLPWLAMLAPLVAMVLIPLLAMVVVTRRDHSRGLAGGSRSAG